MDRHEKIVVIADVLESNCELSHGPYDKEPKKATNAIICPIGKITNQEFKDAEVKRELIIPICNECSEALAEDEWTLLYCLNCNSSAWALRAISRLKYRHHIVWLNGCHKCTNKFGGLYFNEK